MKLLDLLMQRPCAEITFDDGNRSDIEIAAPALRERGLSATFFVLAGKLDTEHFVRPSEIDALLTMGMRIGLHGMHHRPWRCLSEQQQDEEFIVARERIEQVIQRPVVEAACPFGAYDRASLSSLRRLGFRRVFTSDGGRADNSAWLQARTSIRSGDTTESVLQICELARQAPSVVQKVRSVIKRWR